MFLLVALAHAQSPADAPAGDAGDTAANVVYAPVTDLSFDPLAVGGERYVPPIAIHVEPRRAVFNPLIRLRTDFVDEVAASADEVR